MIARLRNGIDELLDPDGTTWIYAPDNALPATVIIDPATAVNRLRDALGPAPNSRGQASSAPAASESPARVA